MAACSALTATRRGTSESTATSSCLWVGETSISQVRTDGRIGGRSRSGFKEEEKCSFNHIFVLFQEEHPCPFPDCLETFVKSVHVKRHLTSNHGVANPLQWLEDQVFSGGF